jgi:hypothetical protein
MTDNSMDSPPQPAGRSLLPWLLVLVVGLLGVALATSPALRQAAMSRLVGTPGEAVEPPAAPTPAERVQAQAAELAQLRQRLEHSETRANTPPAPGSIEALTAMNQRIDALTRRMDTLDRQSGAALANADRAEGMLLALAARRAIETGRPLGVIEGMLRDRFGGSQPRAVTTLITAAQQPVTLPQLTSDFTRLAPALREGDRDGTAGLWTTIRTELGSLFVVRRTGDQPTSVAERIDFAEARLELGDVAGALDQLNRLPAPVRGIGQTWGERARRYVAAREALDALETVALLAPAPDSTERVVPIEPAPPPPAPAI